MNSRTESKPLINILTRTSNRPRGFLNCYLSIKEQTYANIKHFVAYDENSCLEYLNDLNIQLVNVTQLKSDLNSKEADSEGNLYAPYNLYCNALLDKVDDGWVIFLDDDDHLLHNKVIEEIVAIILKNKSINDLYLWQMRYPDGRVLPLDRQIDKEIIQKNYIGSPCYMFHSSHKDKVRWDSYKAADYRFLMQLKEELPNHIFIKKIVAQINNYGDLGRRNDLEVAEIAANKMPWSFYKNIFWYLRPKYHHKVFGKLLFHKNTYKRLLSGSRTKLHAS